MKKLIIFSVLAATMLDANQLAAHEHSNEKTSEQSFDSHIKAREKVYANLGANQRAYIKKLFNSGSYESLYHITKDLYEAKTPTCADGFLSFINRCLFPSRNIDLFYASLQSIIVYASQPEGFIACTMGTLEAFQAIFDENPTHPIAVKLKKYYQQAKQPPCPFPLNCFCSKHFCGCKGQLEQKKKNSKWLSKKSQPIELADPCFGKNSTPRANPTS